MDYFQKTSNEITQCKILGPIIYFFLADLCQYKQFCYLEGILLEYFLEEVASLRYLYIDPNEKMSNKYKSFFF